MTVQPSLRTRDLARAGGISVQQVRNYEAHGLLPKAERSASGYRLYTRQHLAALRTVKSLVPGYGWRHSSAIMQALHRGDLAAALATIDERHAEQARKRLQVEQTLVAIQWLSTPSEASQRSRHFHPVRVGEAARLVSVRVSAVHFWEQQGLLHPVREPHNRYRLYDERQMRRLRVVAQLREAGFAFPVIRSVLDEVAAGQPEQAVATMENKREELARTSWACIEALTFFHHYVSEFGPHSPPAPL